MRPPSQLKALASCLDSLADSLCMAGGSIPPDQLREMTAMNFLEIIAPNGIRFVYNDEGVCR